jgi:hypothetical protein
MNHQIGRVVFGLSVGLLVAYFSYQWITNPAGREERSLQIGVVEASREHLNVAVASGVLEIVDPVSPNRKVGKAYVYPDESGWSVSGYYRRDENDRWHPYLMTLTPDLKMKSLKIQDNASELLERAKTDPTLEISP